MRKLSVFEIPEAENITEVSLSVSFYIKSKINYIYFRLKELFPKMRTLTIGVSSLYYLPDLHSFFKNDGIKKNLSMPSCSNQFQFTQSKLDIQDGNFKLFAAIKLYSVDLAYFEYDSISVNLTIDVNMVEQDGFLIFTSDFAPSVQGLKIDNPDAKPK